jgi:hypothetical protein
MRWEVEWESHLCGEDLRTNGAIKVVYVGIREPDTFIGVNNGINRLENAGVTVKMVDNAPGLRDRILEVTFAGHEK